MTDIRQGLSPATHAVLDMLDAQKKEWSDLYDVQRQLNMAQARAKNALYSRGNPKKQRQYAVEAAARLLDAINEMDREIALDALPDVAAGA